MQHKKHKCCVFSGILNATTIPWPLGQLAQPNCIHALKPSLILLNIELKSRQLHLAF